VLIFVHFKIHEIGACPPGVYLQPRVSLTFDLLTPKVDRFMSSLYVVHLCQFASQSVHSFSNCRVHDFGNERTDGQTDKLLLLDVNVQTSIN